EPEVMEHTSQVAQARPRVVCGSAGLGKAHAPARRWWFRGLLLGLALVLEASLLVWPPLQRQARTALLVSESFPQVPVKPLGVLTSAPAHQSLELDTARGTVVADLFLPTQHFGAPAARSRPALVLAMGVKTSPKDRPLILGLAQNFARLGVVVLW